MSSFVHPVCKQMKELRLAARMSLAEAQDLCGVPDIVVGSYERGDRQPPLVKVEAILNGYGYTLAAVPKDFDAIRLPSDMATELRFIAAQIERILKSDVNCPV